MIETVVESIRVSLVSQHRVVILKEVSGERHLMIWIGPFEADAIAMALQGSEAPRPLPYDLLNSVVSNLGGSITRVLVTDLNQDIFYARIIVEQDGRTAEIDSRPSDAIAVAVRAQVPILVDESVMERAGVTLNSDGEITGTATADSSPVVDNTAPDSSDERLTVFRDFINTLDFEGFDKKRGGS